MPRYLLWAANSPAKSISPLRCVFVIRTCRWRGAPPRLPFFFVAGAFGMTTSAVVAARPSRLYREYKFNTLEMTLTWRKRFQEIYIIWHW